MKDCALEECVGLTVIYKGSTVNFLYGLFSIGYVMNLFRGKKMRRKQVKIVSYHLCSKHASLEVLVLETAIYSFEEIVQFFEKCNKINHS